MRLLEKYVKRPIKKLYYIVKPLPKINLFEHILIQTNNKCNRSCGFCLYGMPDVKIKDDVMSDQLFKKIIKELSEIDYSGRVSLFEINEPLTEPRIIDMVRYVKEHVPKSWQLMVTNGDLLTEKNTIDLIQSGLDYLVISSYDTSNYKKAKCIRNRVPEDTRRHVIVNDFSDPAFARDNRGGNLSRIKQIEEPLVEPCRRVNHVLYIKADGTAVSCFGDFFNVNIVGDAKKQTVTEIWFGEKFQRLRKNLNRGRRQISTICSRCNVGSQKGVFIEAPQGIRTGRRK